MSSFKFAEVPSNESVASLVTLMVAGWFLAAGAAMLSEPTVESQARVLHAKTPVVTVRQVTAMQEEQPATRSTIHVVAQRSVQQERPATRSTIHVVAQRSLPGVS